MSKEDWSKILVIGLPALALIALIGFMKLKSDERSPMLAQQEAALAETPQPADTASVPIAVPDTTVDVTILPVLPDTLPAAPADSMGIDERSPHLAGREDGLLAGAYDRRYAEYGISFDETNTYPTPEEQSAYAEGYREGYDEGFRREPEAPTKGEGEKDNTHQTPTTNS